MTTSFVNMYNSLVNMNNWNIICWCLKQCLKGSTHWLQPFLCEFDMYCWMRMNISYYLMSCLMFYCCFSEGRQYTFSSILLCRWGSVSGRCWAWQLWWTKEPSKMCRTRRSIETGKFVLVVSKLVWKADTMTWSDSECQIVSPIVVSWKGLPTMYDSLA